MSTSVFPTPSTLPGEAWPISRTILWKTTPQENVSGKEFRIALMTYPRYQWDLVFNILRSAAAYQEYQTLIGFINARQGAFDSFLYTDDQDNSVTNQAIATGNGGTSAYQLLRTFGNFIEPILAPNTVSAVMLAGTSIPSAGYSAPGVATLGSSAAGSLGATTYYVKCTWVTNSGETLPGSEANLAVAANHVLTVTQPASPPAGAVSWKIYASNTGGGGSGAETLQATVAIGTTTWTEPTSGLVAGAAMPGANTTGWSVSNWGTTTPGVITFGGNVANSIAITATFTYYWPARFVDDKSMFSEFMSGFNDLKKLSFLSLKA